MPMRPALLLLLATALAAQVPEVVSTAKDRTSLGITLYHGNLAQVRDTRRVLLPAGPSRLAFGGVTREINPKSAWMEVRSGAPLRILERNFEADLLTPASLVDKSLGAPAAFRPFPEAPLAWGTLRSLPLRKPIWAPGRTPLQRIARIGPVKQPVDPRVLVETTEGFSAIEGAQASFQKVPPGLRPSATLLGDLETDTAGPREVELSYTTQGLQWEATYVATLAPNGKTLDLDAWVTLTNKSGADLPNVTLQLAAGEPNQVWDPPPRNLDEPMVDMTQTTMGTNVAPRFKEEKLFEYYLFTLDQPATLLDGQTKRVRLFTSARVPLQRTYCFSWDVNESWFTNPLTQETVPGPWVDRSEEFHAWLEHMMDIDSKDWESRQAIQALPYPKTIPVMEPQIEQPAILFRFKNDRSSHLNRPLPKGSLWLSYLDPSGAGIPIQDMTLDQTPVGEEADMLVDPESFPASGVEARHRWRPIRWTPREASDAERQQKRKARFLEMEGEVELFNARMDEVQTLSRISLGPEASLLSATKPARRLVPDALDFAISVPPHGKRLLKYRARIPVSFPPVDQE